MTTQTILLLDNGSRRAAATLSLRQAAKALEQATGQIIHPVSLQHANHIDPGLVEGRHADTFEAFLRDQLQAGKQEFLAVPLFFGQSRALTSFIPDTISRLQTEFGSFKFELADVLYPLPDGEPRLAMILCDNIQTALHAHDITRARVILVDHGSPTPEVVAVRELLASSMRQILGPEIMLFEAVMERRQGSEYDFSGRLLEEVLDELAIEDPGTPVVLSMLFLAPGRHAGSGGDIESIRDRVVAAHPTLKAVITQLVGDHSGLVPILQERLEAAL